MTTSESESDFRRWLPRPASVAATLGCGLWLLLLQNGLGFTPDRVGFPLVFRVQPSWPEPSLSDRFDLRPFLIDATVALGMLASVYVSAQVIADVFFGRWAFTVRAAAWLIAMIAVVLADLRLSGALTSFLLIGSAGFTLISPFFCLIVGFVVLDQRERRIRAERAEGRHSAGDRP
ncbi:hypothetical protein [Paludisphaera rhizosphaerae]|uniref:hypothetical protein n=1 Tax=Paludisphaera rhizosphaerae TaxID=2711216 RepID=UPI0013ED9017|nr:hypothetical protein [Paludisphaera rhizosphaerae]